MRTRAVFVPLAVAILSFANAASADLIPTYHTEECNSKKEGDACALSTGEKGTCKIQKDKRNTEGVLACSDLKPLMWTDLHPSPSAEPAKAGSKGGCSVAGGEDGWFFFGAIGGIVALFMRRRAR
jgi:hypothetical protein